MLPSNEDFKKLEPLQAYWYYFNLASDSEKLEASYKEAKGASTITRTAGTDQEFIEAVKRDLNKKGK